MDPLLDLALERLTVDPGGEVRVRVTVRNPGELVEQYRFEVLGEAATWAQVLPRDVSVMPGEADEKAVDLVFRPPPAPAAPAGEVPFGVRCVSLEHQGNCAVVEGDVLVSAVVDLQVRLLPFGPEGARRGRFRVEMRNTGTTPVTVEVHAVDGANLLRFALAPERVTVEPRQTSFVYIGVRARTAKLIGRPIDHVVTVTHTVQGAERASEQQVTYTQHSLVPKGLIVAVTLLAVGALALALMLLQPFGDKGDPMLRASAPPGIALTSARPGEPGTVTLAWPRSPYAASYEIQLVQEDGTVVEPHAVPAPQSRYTWKDLPPGKQCFSVVPVNDNGRGPASEPVCAVVAAPPVTPTTTSIPTTSTASGVDNGPPFEPTGWYVVYYRAPLDDKALEGRVGEVAAALQTDGAAPQVVSSLRSETLQDGTNGIWYVLADAFPSREAAQADCAAHQDVPDVVCTVESPR